MFDLIGHLCRQIAFSRATFGPGQRQKGVIDHMKKEMVEVETAETPKKRVKEWVDLVILANDGLWREIAHQHPGWPADAIAEEMVGLIVDKQGTNELRNWPDWRTADPNKAIEHDRTGE